jgi:proteasome lid subunit RPN8/RPN11
VSGADPEGSIEFQAVRQKQGREDRPSFVEAHRTVLGDDKIQSQSTGFELTVELNVLQQMAAHAVSNTKTELGGVLVGIRWGGHDSFADRGVWIGGIIAAEEFQATRGSFTFTHESWTKIAANHRSKFPQFEVVGWYHTHPGWGIFLSSYDQFICNHFFPEWYHVAVVIDPLNNLWGVFDRNQSTSPQERDHFYVRTAEHPQPFRESLLQSCLIPKTNLWHLAPLLECSESNGAESRVGKQDLGGNETRGKS